MQKMLNLMINCGNIFKSHNEIQLHIELDWQKKKKFLTWLECEQAKSLSHC